MDIPTYSRRILYLPLLLLLALPAHAQAPVWKVEKDANTMYIGGHDPHDAGDGDARRVA